MQIHSVVKGETLSSISRDYGGDLSQVIAANQLADPHKLTIGQAIMIPAPHREYIVQPGDNLGTIAQKFHVSAPALAAANQLRPQDSLYPGQLLIIPISYHIVRSGDTLVKIAQQYGATVNALIELNHISNPSALAIGQSIRIPDYARPTKEMNAYIVNFNQSGAAETLKLGRDLTYLSPFRYSFSKDASLSQLREEPILAAARSSRTAALMVLANIGDNDDFSSDLAATVLRSSALQNRLITSILAVLKQKGYSGVNFDFEYIYPEDKLNYNNFLKLVVSRLRPEGYVVSTALAPKVSGTQKGILYEAHDYQVHGEIADFVILMTYEWGWAGGPPLAVAPVNEVKRVLDYAVTVIPPNKILMGMPLYGRDWEIPWKQGTTARTISPQTALSLALEYNAAIQYHPTYLAPYFQYTEKTGQQHEVWFEDARSVQAKFNVMKQYGLRGGSYWVLGYPFPQNWVMQESNLLTEKKL
ncbi:LysM peptidoglycan-binding domain-containing protein [Heyndrickxia acidicola]|uniref:LysM peptidoglycan-binding domain-containing protein n=1 Tax=Heyndrickxia acidicola TaxID=209389 RepID=A0ABU6MNP9_9BACI|nr:LysM peptidoglycan-binding domain-containing protein [Heyndrickxia acidicola]MED1205258.1 LysM peptidoglycan-binding domain-containing protein [Heyndrickxia acidicola]